MKRKAKVRIEIEAVKALTRWKSQFATEVATRARQLAAASSEPDRVTSSHYRKAALIAVRSLTAAIRDGGAAREEHRVA
jgi:hypothetical protein